MTTRSTRKSQDLDTLIRDALSREEAELFDRLGEPSLPELLSETFRGRRSWLMWLTGLVTAVFFGLSIYCAVQFFGADDVPTMLRWGVGLLFCLLAVMANKTWSWMEMQRVAISREIKRLEVAVAHLAAQRGAGREAHAGKDSR
jgi:hypothetical protein